MSLLDDARRLAERGCGGWFSGPGREGWVHGCHWPQIVHADIHAEDCSTPYLPKIVAALEAAERVVEAREPTQELRVVECVYCRANRDLEEYGREEHKPDCPWQALVAALKEPA